MSNPGQSPFQGQSQPVPQQTVIVQQAPPSQALPALANAFIIGLGHLIQGRVLAALFWFVAAIVSTILCSVLIGFLLLPLVWVLSIVDAAKYKPGVPESTNPLKPQGFGLIRIILGSIILLMCFVPLVGFMASLLSSSGPDRAATSEQQSPPQEEPRATSEEQSAGSERSSLPLMPPPAFDPNSLSRTLKWLEQLEERIPVDSNPMRHKGAIEVRKKRLLNTLAQYKGAKVEWDYKVTNMAKSLILGYYLDAEPPEGDGFRIIVGDGVSETLYGKLSVGSAVKAKGKAEFSARDYEHDGRTKIYAVVKLTNIKIVEDSDVPEQDRLAMSRPAEKVAAKKSPPSQQPLTADTQPAPTNESNNTSHVETDEPEESLPVIPGLKPVDVYGNLTNKGFKLQKDFSDLQQPIWRCSEKTSQNEMLVEVFGRTATTVTLVRGTYSNYSSSGTNKDAADFLGYVASIPYDGSRPADARSWVQNNIGTNAKTIIGGVSFEIIVSAPRFRMLLIQPSSETDDTQPEQKSSKRPPRLFTQSNAPNKPLAYRTWTTEDGAYRVEAKFRSMAFGKVKLERKDNGKVLEVPLDKLSSKDREWIKSRKYSKD